MPSSTALFKTLVLAIVVTAKGTKYVVGGEDCSAITGEGSCSLVEDVNECAASMNLQLPDGQIISVTGIAGNQGDNEPRGCWNYEQYVYFNLDAGIVTYNTGQYPVCACTTPTPTPAPTASTGSMAGDPIVRVNGFRVKVDLPVSSDTLIWKDDSLALFARADIISADKKSQWFSEFSLVVDGKTRAVIRRGEKHLSSAADPDAVNDLSITAFDSMGNASKIKTANSKTIMEDGKVTMSVMPSSSVIGGPRRETVRIKSKLFDFDIQAEVAKKFRSLAEGQRYQHLDIHMQAMRPGVKAGLLAEIYGFVPMSAESAKRIKHVRREQ